MRHRHDYGAIVFADPRFQKANVISSLSRSVQTYTHADAPVHTRADIHAHAPVYETFAARSVSLYTHHMHRRLVYSFVDTNGLHRASKTHPHAHIKVGASIYEALRDD